MGQSTIAVRMIATTMQAMDHGDFHVGSVEEADSSSSSAGCMAETVTMQKR